MRWWTKEAARKSLLARIRPEDYPLPEQVRERLRRLFGRGVSAGEAVSLIIERVGQEGDKALFDLTEKLDGFRPPALEVPAREVQRARELIPRELLSAMELAAERVSSFYRRTEARSIPGKLCRPLRRVGLYVPGGRAVYFSTVLMTVIPAKVCGVPEVFLTTPPGSSGKVMPEVLAAAAVSGADRVFSIGGAQAVAALALGTETIPRVDKVCGPGNIFVQLAKKQLYGLVDIDGLYGPSELLILADGSADPSRCAAELMAQAEHDPMARAVLITPERRLAERVEEELDKLLPGLERREIIEQSLESNGGVVVVDGMEEGIELVNEFAPEHLLLLVEGAEKYLDLILNAGSISVNSPVALADYIYGPSHVLPTGGSARFASPLGAESFLKTTHLISPEPGEIKELIEPARLMALAEGLTAHALSLKMWEERLAEK